MTSSKKSSSKKIETFIDLVIGNYYLSKLDNNEYYMYNMDTNEKIPISKEYYNYRKFASGNSNIKPIHILAIPNIYSIKSTRENSTLSKRKKDKFLDAIKSIKFTSRPKKRTKFS